MVSVSNLPALPGANQVRMGFDFLDPYDGLSLEILHSGKSREAKLMGTIRGMPKGMTNHGRASFAARRRRPFPANRPRLVLGIAVVIGCFMLVSGLLRPQLARTFPNFYTRPRLDPYSVDWVFVLLGALYAFLAGYLLWSRRRRYPAVLEPLVTPEDPASQGSNGPLAAPG